MRSLRLALGCLTIVPVAPRGAVREEALGASMGWFPLVGVGIGAMLAGVHALTSRVCPPLVVAACVLASWMAITGALHLDGLGDVCDGLYGGRSREERLRLMKDPHVGAMAVVGVSGLLLLKFALLASLDPRAATRALLLSPCLGRYAMVLLGTTLRYARAGEGTAAPFVRHASPSTLLAATAITLAASAAFLGATGLGLLALTLAATGLLRSVFSRTLGGVTGDALGATGELIETLVLFGAALASVHVPA